MTRLCVHLQPEKRKRLFSRPRFHPFSFFAVQTRAVTSQIVTPLRQKIDLKYKAINKVKDVVCFLLSCRKYFCKYVESIKYLLDSASFDDSDKTIMYRGICVDKMWLCNLCTFATRPIKVLFSYFKIALFHLFCFAYYS